MQSGSKTVFNQLATVTVAYVSFRNRVAHMIHSSQKQFQPEKTGYSRESRVSWIGSKLAQSTGLPTERLDGLHHRMWMRILQGDLACTPPRDEIDHLAANIVAVATCAEAASAQGGAKAAISAVMQAAGDGIDPLLAQNFIRLASSPIFWMALDSDGISS
jgi:hypothetical protein